MELDAIERKALDLLRNRLQDGNITVLSAKREPTAQDQVTVNGTFQDANGRQRRFEVRFEIKRGEPILLGWSVS